MDQTSVLLISAEDTDAARLLTRALLERGSAVGVLSPVPFPQERFPGVALIDARTLGARELEPWFRSRPYSVLVDLGAFRPESIELLRKLHASDIDRYIFCSSTEVYAPGLEPPLDEAAPLGSGSGELLSVERYLAALRDAGAFPATVLRSSPIYGEGRGLLSYLFDRILFGEGVLCPRPLEDALQPLYVGDWVEALVGLVEHPAAQGEVFNLVGSEWTTLGEFLERTAEAAYTALRAYRYSAADVSPEQLAELDPFPLSGQGHQLCSGTKLGQLCSIEARTPLDVGLEQGFVRYLEQAGDIPEPNLAAERRLIASLGLRVLAPPAAEPAAAEPEPPAARPSAGQLGAPGRIGLGPAPAASTASGAGRMGAPSRTGSGASLAPLRRPRDPSELPPPSSIPAEVLEQRLDTMVDLMLSGVNRSGENETQIEMKDAVLGGLHIKISQKQRHVRASFGCKQREARATLEENFPHLRRKLETRGYFVDELVVRVVG